MSMGRKQGEEVSLSYSASAVPSTVASITIYDANQNARTLQPYERLILDMLAFDTEASDTTNLAYIVAGGGSVATPTVPASGAVPAAPVIAAFTVQQGIPDQGIVWPAEGESLPIGAVPYLVVPTTGTGLTGSVTVNGSGRIINGKSQGPRPNWQCALTPGGTN